MKGCMKALVAQLKSDNEDLRQVAASVLRNLSWRADLASKKILREVGSVVALMKCALEVKKESTLKSVLSALWNLSAHFTENKADICAVDGALEFLVGTLTYKSPTRTWAVVENGGGILRNVSSHIATNENYRRTLRGNNCMQILLRHLKSSSLTIVSNACGTLWNLSARNKQDQDLLWELGAVSMLKNLVHSKHKMIAMGSSAALRNLMSARPNLLNASEHHKDGPPTLHVRKQRALEAEIDKNLRETYGNIEERNKVSLQMFPRHAPMRNSTGHIKERSQNPPDYSPVPQRIPIWNAQQSSSPTHEMLQSQQQQQQHQHHQHRSHSPSNRQQQYHPPYHSESSDGEPHQGQVKGHGLNYQGQVKSPSSGTVQETDIDAGTGSVEGMSSPKKTSDNSQRRPPGTPGTSRIAKVKSNFNQSNLISQFSDVSTAIIV